MIKKVIKKIEIKTSDWIGKKAKTRHQANLFA